MCWNNCNILNQRVKHNKTTYCNISKSTIKYNKKSANPQILPSPDPSRPEGEQASLAEELKHAHFAELAPAAFARGEENVYFLKK